MKAVLNNYRQAPRKVRLVANLIKGKTVPLALAQLELLPRRAAEPLAKLLRSALANAGVATGEDFIVSEIRVDQGVVLKRSRPRARGSAFPIHKRTSHVRLALARRAAK